MLSLGIRNQETIGVPTSLPQPCNFACGMADWNISMGTTFHRSLQGDVPIRSRRALASECLAHQLILRIGLDQTTVLSGSSKCTMQTNLGSELFHVVRSSSTDCHAFAIVARKQDNGSGVDILSLGIDEGDILSLAVVSLSCRRLFVPGSSIDLNIQK